MLVPEQVPLGRHPIFASKDGERVRDFVSHKGFDFVLPLRGRHPVDACINAVYLPNLELTYIQYGADAITGAAAERGDYRVHFTLRGKAEFEMDGRHFAARPGGATITSPVGYQTVRSDPDFRRLSVFLPGETIERQLTALLGEAVKGPVRITPDLDLAQGAGRTLGRLVFLFAQEANEDESVIRNPLVMAQFEQLFLNALLLGQPHSYSSALHAPAPAIAPRDVKRALDYIHAHLDAPIGITELVAVSGVPGRTLRQHFRDFRGLAPLAYVRLARLKRVRADLLQAGPQVTVTTVARRWGFEHMGRFAATYRRSFGEAPSETLKRSPHR